MGNNNSNGNGNGKKKGNGLITRAGRRAKGYVSRKLAERKTRKTHEKMLKMKAKAIEEEAFREARAEAEAERAVQRGIARGKRVRMTRTEKLEEAGKLVGRKAERAIRFAHQVGVAGKDVRVDLFGSYGRPTLAPVEVRTKAPRKTSVKKVRGKRKVQPTAVTIPNVASTILGGGGLNIGGITGRKTTQKVTRAKIAPSAKTGLQLQGMHETLGLNEWVNQRKKKRK